MEKVIKVVAMITYMFTVDEELDDEEATTEIEDRIRSCECFPTDVVNCELLSVAPA